MIKLEDEIDALFQQPLAEFTSSRNALASRLKKDGRANDAERVKILTKPSVSAWAVNQLYWEHRDAFDELIATGKRFRAGSRSAGKAANMRDSLDARREALEQLSDLATELLTDAGHNPSLDTMRRITTTLEALSAYALLGDGPTPGRLSNDVDPPSFESLALLMSGVSVDDVAERPSRKSSAAPVPAKRPKSAPPKSSSDDEARKHRQLRIAAAKLSLQDAKKSLVDARTRVQSLESAQKKAKAEAKEAETVRREAELRLQKATAASEAATRRAQSVAEEAEEAAQAIEDAKRSVEEATKELESSLRE